MLEFAANIGELVGGIGTLAALIYLALQVRQNNRIARGSSRQALLDTFYDRAWQTGVDKHLATIFASGLRDWNSLSNEDKTAFTNMIVRWISNIENGMQLEQDGLIERETVSFIASAMAGCLQSPGGAEWWEEHKTTLVISTNVVEILEEIIASGDVPPFEQTFPYWYEMGNRT